MPHRIHAALVRWWWWCDCLEVESGSNFWLEKIIIFRVTICDFKKWRDFLSSFPSRWRLFLASLWLSTKLLDLQLRRVSFLKWAIPGLLFLYFRLFNTVDRSTNWATTLPYTPHFEILGKDIWPPFLHLTKKSCNGRGSLICLWCSSIRHCLECNF